MIIARRSLEYRHSLHAPLSKLGRRSEVSWTDDRLDISPPLPWALDAHTAIPANQVLCKALNNTIPS